jgi:hypothetical protein
MSNLVNEKYGYVENVEHDDEYQNVDYRDTIAPLWSTLYKIKKGTSGFNVSNQTDINLAMCASIIQLSKCVTQNFKYMSTKLKHMETRYNDICDAIDELDKYKY